MVQYMKLSFMREINIIEQYLPCQEKDFTFDIKVDKTLLFRGMTIEKFPFCVKEKVTRKK